MRNAVTGHRATQVFATSYFSNHLRFDVQGTVSGSGRNKVVEDSTTMGAVADPRAPISLDTQDLAEIAATPESKEAMKRVEELNPFQAGVYKQPNSSEQLAAYRTAKRKQYQISKRLKRVRLKAKRLEYFSNANKRDLENQRQGASTYGAGPIDQSKSVPERELVVSLFAKQGTVPSQDILGYRIEIVQALQALCRAYDPCAHVALSGKQRVRADPLVSYTPPTTEFDARAYIESFGSWKERSMFCPFCIVCATSTDEALAVKHSKVDGMRRHVQAKHFTRMADPDGFRRCPFGCTVDLSCKSHFLGHLQAEHMIKLEPFQKGRRKV